MPFYSIDIYYIVLVLPAIIFSMWASIRVNSTFKKYSKDTNMRGITADQAARMVLDANGLYNVPIERVNGKLSDHYDPKTNVIRLSDSVYGNSSTAAIGVACHEAGHAIQHAQDYTPVKIRTAIVPVTNIGSTLSIPLIILGLILSINELAYLGIICFCLCVVFQLVTLPTEYNASNRAMKAITASFILTEDEQKSAKKVLNAAAMTYVAALAVSVMQLLRLVLIVAGNDRD